MTRAAYTYANNDPLNFTDPFGLGPYHECPSGEVWSEGSCGCIMTGSQTPAYIQPGTVGSNNGLEQNQENCDPLTTSSGIQPGNPTTYQPETDIVDPYGLFVSISDVIDTLTHVLACGNDVLLAANDVNTAETGIEAIGVGAVTDDLILAGTGDGTVLLGIHNLKSNVHQIGQDCG